MMALFPVPLFPKHVSTPYTHMYTIHIVACLDNRHPYSPTIPIPLYQCATNFHFSFCFQAMQQRRGPSGLPERGRRGLALYSAAIVKGAFPCHVRAPLISCPVCATMESMATRVQPTSAHNLPGVQNPNSKFNLYADKILEAMRLGNTMPAACRQVGCSPELVHSWLYVMRKKPGLYPEYEEFAEKMEQVKAEVQAEMVDVIRTTALSGAPNTWQAAAWYLERSDPANWSRRDKVTVQNEGAPLVQINQVILGDDDAREASRDLLRRLTADRTDEPLRTGSRGELASGDDGGSRLEVIDVDPR